MTFHPTAAQKNLPALRTRSRISRLFDLPMAITFPEVAPLAFLIFFARLLFVLLLILRRLIGIIWLFNLTMAPALSLVAPFALLLLLVLLRGLLLIIPLLLTLAPRLLATTTHHLHQLLHQLHLPQLHPR